MQGAWNLHHALKDTQLHFLLLFSSLSAIVGLRGQANYAAANTFLDSFVQYRHSLGLPASAIDIGVVEDVGYVSENPAVLEQFKANSAHTLREQDLLDALELMILQQSAAPPTAHGYTNAAQLTIGLKSTKPLADPSNRTIWKRDARVSLYHNLETQTASSSTASDRGLANFLRDVAARPALLDEPDSLAFLTREIGAQLYGFMLRGEDDVDEEQSLTALGVDSLVAIEIRNWWRHQLGLEISVLEIVNAGSIRQLGSNAHEALRCKYMPEAGKDLDAILAMKAP